MNNKLVFKIAGGVCLALSLLITYLMYQWGLGEAMQSHEVPVWPFFVSFFVSIALVVVAIVFRTKSNKK
jgi:membrane protein implicated in regulation of membrane protease activity